MRVFLTGASGFVGNAALGALVRRGIDTIAASRRRPFENGRFEWLPLDLLDHSRVMEAVDATRPDAILHVAWAVEHGTFWSSQANLDWVSATLNLCRAAVRAGTKRLIGTGTCYEYDWPPDGDCREGVTPLAPAPLYAVAKDATRRVLEAFSGASGMSFAWARLFFLYGPGEGSARLVPSVARSLAANQPAECSLGQAVRDFMDVRDAGEALVALALSEVTGAVNVASGIGVTIAELALTLERLAAKNGLVRLGALPDRSGEPPRIVADVSRLNREVGFKTGRSLEAGLKDALAYWTRLGQRGPSHA